MPEGLRKVMQGKRLLLLKQVLIDANLPHKDVLHRLTTGFEIVGSLCKTGLFEEQSKLASMAVKDLWSKAKWAQASVMSKVKASGDAELDSILWAETISERDRGWLAGPFSPAELKQRNGPLWNPSPRFALRQGSGKTRMIDDFSYYSTNATVSQYEKLNLGGVDEVVSLASAFMQCASGQWETLESLEGRTYPIKRHADWVNKRVDLVGRTLDLKSAYRQLGVSTADSWAAIIAVYDPHSKAPVFFESKGLPFGATAAVLSFNWMSRLLKRAMGHLLFIMSGCYFDDFPMLESTALAASTRVCRRVPNTFRLRSGFGGEEGQGLRS
jgi:hypothetical protein